MRAAAALRRAAVVVVASVIVVSGGGAAHAAVVPAELGCTTGGIVAFFGGEECPPAPGDAPAETTAPPTDPTALPIDPTEPTDPTDPAAPGTPTAPDGTAPAPTPAPGPVPDAPADPAGMVFTANPAILTASTLSLEGLHSLEIVTVDLADGSTSRALKITADRVVIEGFGLDVPSGGGGLNTTASTLTVEGNVTIWTPSITAILADGLEHVIDTLSAPDPAALAGLLKLRLPLLGMSADRVAYTDTDQATYEG